MAYLAVNKDGTEALFPYKPYRKESFGAWFCHYDAFIEIPKGSVKKLIGKNLTYEDEPIEII